MNLNFEFKILIIKFFKCFLKFKNNLKKKKCYFGNNLEEFLFETLIKNLTLNNYLKSSNIYKVFFILRF